MVCGWLTVDNAERWCDLVGNQLRVFTATPEAVLEVPKGQRFEKAGSWDIAGHAVKSDGAESVREYWAECLTQCCGDHAEGLRLRERDIERREIALMWREHELAVAEESAKLGMPWRCGTGDATSSCGVSAEASSSRGTARRHNRAPSKQTGRTGSLPSTASARTSTSPSVPRDADAAPGAQQAALQRQVADLASQIEALQKLTAAAGLATAAATTTAAEAAVDSPAPSPQTVRADTAARYYEGTLAQDAGAIESGIEVLDSPSPVRTARTAAVRQHTPRAVTPTPAVSAPRESSRASVASQATTEGGNSAGAPPALAPQRMVLEVPGKTVVLDPCPGGRGMLLEVNGEALGELTWLGYDAGRRWLTTATASSRSGLALPDGPAGSALVTQLAELAAATGTQNNLPSAVLKVGDQVKTLKTFRFSSGKHLPAGTLGRVVRLSANGVRVRTMTNELFHTPAHTLVGVGETAPPPMPMNKKIADYVSTNLHAEPAQAQLHELDNELDALLNFANGM